MADDFDAWYAELTESDKMDMLRGVHNGCTCEACSPNTFGNMRMILCAKCGNKRCPHATNHRNACTGSNEPGQPGSSWEHVTPAFDTAALPSRLRYDPCDPGHWRDSDDAMGASHEREQTALTQEDVERQYRDGIHIGSGLPRATCPCGFCAKHRFGFNSGDAPKDELSSMARMLHDACSDLGSINESLGLDPEDGGAKPILAAIAELKGSMAALTAEIDALRRERDELRGAFKGATIIATAAGMEIRDLRAKHGASRIDANAELLRAHGMNYYAPDGTFMNADGTRSIFDDVDE